MTLTSRGTVAEKPTVRDPTFLTRVVLRNYKSIASCDVRLGPLMFLVGPNAAGKSNFLDGLHFVNDALVRSLDHAFRERGGSRRVFHQPAGPGAALGAVLGVHFACASAAAHA